MGYRCEIDEKNAEAGFSERGIRRLVESDAPAIVVFVVWFTVI